MAQIRVASLDNALMVVRNPPSDTGLRAAGLSTTLPLEIILDLPFGFPINNIISHCHLPATSAA